MLLAQALINGDVFLAALVQIVIAGLICWVLWWLIGYIGLPAPFDKGARVCVALFAAFVLINVLLSFSGHPLIDWGWRSRY